MWWQLGEPADPRQVEAVCARAARSAPRCGSTAIIAVDGRSGSGKTTLATAVAARLDAALIHLDDFVPGWDGLAASVQILVTRILEPLARGECATYPVWDWTLSQWQGQRTVAPQPFVVVDGCGCTSGQARSYAALTVFVAAPPRVRKDRALTRDGEDYRPHWERWARQEQALLAAEGSRERADLIIDTGADA